MNAAVITLSEETDRASSPDIWNQRVRELDIALRHVEGARLAQWGVEGGKLFLEAGVRRIGNLGTLAAKIASGTTNFVTECVAATRSGTLGNHLHSESRLAWKTTKDWAEAGKRNVSRLQELYKTNRAEAALHVFVAAFVSTSVAGGLDADGGAPDLDLNFGIGEHRAFWSHSIVMGAALEAAILSALGLVTVVYDQLPDGYDPWWDEVYGVASRVTTSATVGAGLGMAYHLFGDGIFQPAAYHHLPWSMPMWGHQALIDANAAMESLDVPEKPSVVERWFGRMSSAQCVLWLHYVVAARRSRVPAEIAAQLSAADVAFLEQSAMWLSALEQGVLLPASTAQRRFFDVARGALPPTSWEETLWIRVKRLLAESRAPKADIASPKADIASPPQAPPQTVASDAKLDSGVMPDRAEEGELTAQSRQREFLARGMVVHPSVAACLSPEHIALLSAHGSLLKALHHGKVRPVGPGQRQFVDAAHGRRQPERAHELAWHAFREAQKRLGHLS